MLGLMILGTWIGLSCCTPADAERPSFDVIVSLAILLLSIMACWAGVALVLAAAARRRAVEPMTLIMGQPLSSRNLSVLFGIALAGSAASYVIFMKRDI